MKKLTDIIAKLSNLVVYTEEEAKEQFNLRSLTHVQMHYLETINMLGNPNITELAASLKLTKPTVTVAVDRLIERDFVVKIKSDADRRSAHLHLTEKGKLINQMHDYAHKLIAESIAKKLDKREIEILTGLLSKVL